MCGCRGPATRRPATGNKQPATPQAAQTHGRIIPAPGSNDRWSGPKKKQ